MSWVQAQCLDFNFISVAVAKYPNGSNFRGEEIHLAQGSITLEK